MSQENEMNAPERANKAQSATETISGLCPHCQNPFATSLKFVGRRVKCNQCDRAFTIAPPDRAPSPAQAAAGQVPHTAATGPSVSPLINTAGDTTGQDATGRSPQSSNPQADPRRVPKLDLPKLCPRCGATNEGSGRFCGACGMMLAQKNDQAPASTLGMERTPPELSCPQCYSTDIRRPYRWRAFGIVVGAFFLVGVLTQVIRGLLVDVASACVVIALFWTFFSALMGKNRCNVCDHRWKRDTHQDDGSMPAAASPLPGSGFEPPDSRYRGYGGWLAFFCIAQIVALPAAAILLFIVNYATENKEFVRIYPRTHILIHLESCIWLAIVGFGVYAGIMLRRLRPGAVRIAKRYLLASLAFSIVGLFTPLMYDLPSRAKETLMQDSHGPVAVFVRTLIGFAIWFTYFNVSRRVKATYPAAESTIFALSPPQEMSSDRLSRIAGGLIRQVKSRFLGGYVRSAADWLSPPPSAPGASQPAQNVATLPAPIAASSRASAMKTLSDAQGTPCTLSPAETVNAAGRRTLGWIFLILWVSLSVGPPLVMIGKLPQRASHLEITEIPGDLASGYSSHSKLTIAGEPGNPRDVIISAEEGSSFGVRALWGAGAEHTIEGTVETKKWIFESSSHNPLVFRVGKENYIYLKGQGTVTNPRGDVVALGTTGIAVGKWPIILLSSLLFVLSPLLMLSMRCLSRRSDEWFKQRNTHAVGRFVCSATDSLSHAAEALIRQGKTRPLGGVVRSIAGSLTASGNPEDNSQSMTIGEKELRDAARRVVKGVIGIAALLVVCWFLKKPDHVSHRTFLDWMRVVLTLGVVVNAIKLYRSFTAIAVFYMAAWVKVGRVPDRDKYMGNVIATAGKLTLLAYVLSMYGYLLPWIPEGFLTGLVNLSLCIAVIWILIGLWKNGQPLLKLLTGPRIGQTSALSSHGASVNCSACNARNSSDAAFCSSCGTKLEQKVAPPPPPIEQGTCPRCAVKNGPVAKFCGKCGNAL